MAEIDRRNVIGASAMLALAGCSRATEPKPRERKAAATTRDRSIESFGPGYQFGDPAEKPKAEPTNLFVPDYICAVYIGLAPGGGLIIRHGYEKVTSESHDVTARTLLAAAKKADNADWKHPQSEKYKRKEIGFDQFTFGTRQKIYILVDEDEKILKFDERNGKKTIIRFSPYSGQNYSAGPVMKENYAFYDLDIQDFSLVQGQPRRIVTLNYWNTDEEGEQIDAEPNNQDSWYVYSMNIHLLMSAGNRGSGDKDRWIPVIIDPDTGNMGGKP